MESVEELGHRSLLAGVLTCGGVSEEALNAGLDGGLNAALNGRKFRPISSGQT
jgi:hypothetical protein